MHMTSWGKRFGQVVLGHPFTSDQWQNLCGHMPTFPTIHSIPITLRKDFVHIGTLLLRYIKLLAMIDISGLKRTKDSYMFYTVRQTQVLLRTT